MGLRTLEAVMTGLLVACSSPPPSTEDMGSMEDGHDHMAYIAPRPGTAADTARALDVVHRLRAAIGRYATPASAESAGYLVRAMAGMQDRHMMHMSRPKSLAGIGTFDPSTPQSLVYRRDESGQFRLAGAMFVAPRGITEDELDARVPLSVAHWHRHVDVCRGPKGEMAPRYHQWLTLADCEKAGGRWRPASHYMIHVMVDSGDDLAAVFPQRPDSD